MIWIVLIAIVLVLIFWVVSVQRQLVSVDELCGNAMSQIGVQQASRWDALSALADLTKKYDEHEYQTLMDTVAKRQQITPKSTAAEVDAQENMLTSAMSRFMAVAENYPDLKADQVYIKTMDSVNQYENNVRLSRMSYNDTVTKMNRMVRQFPGSLLAGPMGFGVRDYLQADTTKAEMPKMG